MAKRSSKTSHVLDLITRRSAPPENPPDGMPESPQENQASADYDTCDDSLSVSEMMLDSELCDHASAEDSSPPGLTRKTETTADHQLQWDSQQDREPVLLQPEKKSASAKHSELRSMLEDEPDSDEEVSLKLRDALESFFDKEHPKAAFHSPSGPPEDERYLKQGSVIIESEDYDMDQKEKAFHPLSGLGTEFTFDSMDSVESDLSGASFSDENRDLSESPHDLTPGKYMFVNVAEEIVRSKVPAMMRDYDMCTCERCTNDVVALTLNRIPPKYVVTMKGKLYARINACLPQYQTDMLAAITAACQTVKNNSRHNSAPDRLK